MMCNVIKMTAVFLFAIFMFSCKQKMSQYGLVFSEEAYDKVPRKARLVTRDYESLPEKIDLRDFAPSVGDQGSYGTCVAWATAYCAMSFSDAYHNRSYFTDCFSPYYLYRKCKPYDKLAKLGMQVEKALDFLKDNGVPYRDKSEEFQEFAYFDVSVYEANPKYKIENYATLFSTRSSSDFKISAVKKSLSEYKAVVITMFLPESFSSCGDVFYGGDEPGRNSGHAMCLVGYDDKKYGGSFLIQNSWGDDWGNNGYTWIPYSVFSDKKYLKGAYEVENKVFRKVDASYEQIDLPEDVFDKDEKQIVFKGSFSLPLSYRDEEIEVAYDRDCYSSVKSYSSLERFQFYMTNEKPCYVYAFASDDVTGKAVKIFPENNVSAYLSYSKNTICYPSENTYVEFDEVSGTDYLIVLYSHVELEFDEIIKKYERAVKEGILDFYERVSFSVGEEKMMSRDFVNYSKDKIAFEGYAYKTDMNELVLPILIKLHHVN